MSDLAKKGTWVEVYKIVLEKGERAPQVPDDTRDLPLEMRVKGFLLHDAALGEEAEVVTAAGRKIIGTLTEINPVYDHLYGRPIPELSSIGGEVRAILRERGVIL